MVSERVVKKRLADGTIKEFRYPRVRPAANKPADSIGALIEAYKRSSEWRTLRPATLQYYSRYLAVLDELRDQPVTVLRRRDVLTTRDEVAILRGPSAATAFVRTMSALMSWAVDREWIEHSPAARVKMPKSGHYPAWTEHEYESAIARLPEPLRRAVVLARHTGQRRSDLVAMPWSAYDGATVRLRQRKTGVALVIPATAELRHELSVWTKLGPMILTSPHGRPWRDNGDHLSSMLARAMTNLGMPGLNVHGLRKLAASSLAEAGCTMHEIASITGHDTLSMVQLYTKSAQQEQLAGAAIVRLDAARERRGRQPA